MAAAATLVAKASALQKHDFSGSGSALESAAAVQRQRQKHGGRGGSGGSAVGSTAAVGVGRDVLYNSHVLKSFLYIPFSGSLQDLDN